MYISVIISPPPKIYAILLKYSPLTSPLKSPAIIPLAAIAVGNVPFTTVVGSGFFLVITLAVALFTYNFL